MILDLATPLGVTIAVLALIGVVSVGKRVVFPVSIVAVGLALELVATLLDRATYWLARRAGAVTVTVTGDEGEQLSDDHWCSSWVTRSLRVVSRLDKVKHKAFDRL